MGQLGCNDLISLQFLFYNMRLKNMRRLIITFIVTGIITILTGCAKGTIEMLETTAPTEQEETTEIPTTTVQDETTEAITEAPTEPPTTWEESIDWATKEEMKEALDTLQVSNGIQAVILDNKTVSDSSDGKEKLLSDVIAVNEHRVGYISEIRTVDMDQDGEKELIIAGVPKENIVAVSFMLLKEYDDGKISVFSWNTYRVTIAETGYVDTWGGVSRGGVHKLLFDGYEVKRIGMAEYDYEKGYYSIGGKEVSSEEFQKFMEPHDFDNSYINSNTLRINYNL